MLLLLLLGSYLPMPMNSLAASTLMMDSSIMSHKVEMKMMREYTKMLVLRPKASEMRLLSMEPKAEPKIIMATYWV